jgi:hypothetical protein
VGDIPLSTSKVTLLSVVAFSLVASGCQKKAEINPITTPVTAGDPFVNRQVGDQPIRALGEAALANMAAAGTVELAESGIGKGDLEGMTVVRDLDLPVAAPSGSGSLVVSLPLNMLGEQYVFGGVITKVSDQTSETLGRLKLIDLTPLHVRLVVGKTTAGKYVLAMLGCVQSCSETSAQQALMGLPVVGLDSSKQNLIVDLSAVGSQLDLVGMVDPNGEYTGLKTKVAKTVALDYSLSTLVFDVDSHMIPLTAQENDPNVPETVMTARWYLRLASAFNPAFVPRSPLPQTGFFTTERSKDTRITRFSQTEFGGTPVKYYIKNVPTEWQGAFKAALDEWNAKLKPLLGRELLTYEIINANDPRAALLTPGDVRYNIIEWDLVNKAPYGGLGPSIANQFTGETLSANILIQGPTIITLYTDWYKASTQAQALMAQGQSEQAQKVLHDAKLAIDAQVARLSGPKVQLKLGHLLEFRMTSQMPALEDPLFARNDFEPIPAGFTFQQYMNGYFQEMVAHEMGHNLGLRHNFRGNLGAADGVQLGKVSRSVMEYLGRGFRYVDRIGPYDLMAIGYGYTGAQPTHDDWFCTDEDKPTADNVTQTSAECSSDDATNDPYAWLQSRLDYGIELLTAKGSATAPVWTVADMDGQLGVAITGQTLYAATAANSGSKWTNFFKAGRPSTPADVPAFVIQNLHDQLCNPALDQLAAQKPTADARAKTQANLKDLRAKAVTLVAPFGIPAAALCQ